MWNCSFSSRILNPAHVAPPCLLSTFCHLHLAQDSMRPCCDAEQFPTPTLGILLVFSQAEGDVSRHVTPACVCSVASVSARPDRATACASTTTIRSRPSSSSRPVVAGGVSRSGAPIGPRVYRARREDGHPPAGHATCASVATKRSRVTSCLLEALPRGDWDLAGPRTNSSTCKHFRSACCLFPPLPDRDIIGTGTALPLARSDRPSYESLRTGAIVGSSSTVGCGSVESGPESWTPTFSGFRNSRGSTSLRQASASPSRNHCCHAACRIWGAVPTAPGDMQGPTHPKLLQFAMVSRWGS